MKPQAQSTIAEELFAKAMTLHSAKEIAGLLCVQYGTVDRWIRIGKVPPFYKNDFLRILGEECDVGIEQSDQFYTLPSVAKNCIADLKNTLRKYNIRTNKYTFVEPSAGCGCFYNHLPPRKRIGIDIDPQESPFDRAYQSEIVKADFLQWTAPPGNHITIGNPPFGRNGKTALDFVIKAFEFSDFVGFILPPIFNSTGKGSCKNRLLKTGFTLLESKPLDDRSFVYPDGRSVGVKTIFQVWAKNKPHGYFEPAPKSCKSFIDIYNIYLSYKPSRPSSRVHLVGKCDIYIPRSFWGSKDARASFDFADIPYKDGYGVIVKRQKRRVINFIKRFDWGAVAHVSTNGSMSLRKDIIFEQIVKAGFVD